MQGIVPSLNTPFDISGAIDHDALRKLVHHTIDAGCGGMLGLAVAGEASTFSFDEKTDVIATVSDATANRIPFIASVTAPQISESLELARFARSHRVPGICIQLPRELAGSGRRDFLRELGTAAPDIVMVQDLDWTGSGLSVDEIVALHGCIPRFSWLKIETQRAGPKYSAVLKATKGALNVCGGWAVTQLMDAMARGVHAFIPTGLEHVYVAIYRHYKSGNITDARKLFERVLPILNFSNQDVNISIRFFKELRKAQGLFGTSKCRIPGACFDPVQQVEADVALDAALRLEHEIARRS
ncbi:dihydrodipicolinate synthase family protein [Roseobacter sp. YSTF-M11]|uniref:Dihydrodipicolinate synthase family protein n=1 Tax=Roseobacter insulae TaxID=2859783 RepID=A0A9X1FTB8_9RHOB|nr:dihydrodipicolinate synthase family protein [Roseobacter insulae]MBW4707405.1 dihydrodipicolinate synthase family protein [Roseobacter insulae]